MDGGGVRHGSFEGFEVWLSKLESRYTVKILDMIDGTVDE